MSSLSIVIPTLNRIEFLRIALDNFVQQIPYSHIKLEICVCDNASNDGTSGLFGEGSLYEQIRYYRFTERVDSDTSFQRAVRVATGEYILLFGDDDVPLPGFVAHITKIIADHDAIELLYVNRIIGDEKLDLATEIPHSSAPYGVTLLSTSDFISKFTHWPSFISSLVFARRIWQERVTSYEGYNYYYSQLIGSRDGRVAFAASPLVLQRRGRQTWKNKWPLYWLVSMPKLLKDLETAGVTHGALNKWANEEVTHVKFFIDCVVAKAYNYGVNSAFWKDSRSYQTSKIRIFGSFLIQFFLPTFLAKLFYSKFGKMT